MSQSCPVLPSASSAQQILDGDMGGLPTAVLHTLVRAGLIGTGMYLAGVRKGLLAGAVGGSLAIETFVLAWLYINKPPEKTA